MTKTNKTPAAKTDGTEQEDRLDRIIVVEWRTGRVARKLKKARLQYRDDLEEVRMLLDEAA